MPKVNKNIFYKKLTFDKMLAAFYRARENKSKHYPVMEFEFKLENNIVDLVTELRTGEYRVGRYREFTVYEPKERVIKALPFRDRVVHQWYVYEFIIPNLVPRFIYDSYACIKGKGTHSAVNRLVYFMRCARNNYNEFYVLKMDIKKFFYSIDPNILINIMKKYFKDKAFIHLTSTLIFEKGIDVGIPIGNYTSQYFTNIYLNELDQYVKHKLRLKYYLRFMDDFVILLKSKEEAKEVFLKIKNFLLQNLNLELNHKSSYYPSAMGVDFCGYRVYHTHRLVRKRSKNNMKKRIKNWNLMYEKGIKLNKHLISQSVNSWKSHIKHAESYNLYKSYLRKIKFDLPIKDDYLKKESIIIQLSFFSSDDFL